METPENRNAEHFRAMGSFAENVVWLAATISDHLDMHNDRNDDETNESRLPCLRGSSTDGLLNAAATIIAARSAETLIPNYEYICEDCYPEDE